MKYQLSIRKAVIQETDVRLLQVLSKPLQMELVQHTTGPVLRVHPFFRYYARLSSGAMRAICGPPTATSHSLSLGDLIFTDGSIDDRMIFLLKGQLQYTWLARLAGGEGPAAGGEPETFLLEDGDWCCEASLWTRWVHVGTLQAVTESEILALDAKRFIDVTKEYHLVAHACALYCDLFLESMNQATENDVPLSDLRGTTSLFV